MVLQKGRLGQWDYTINLANFTIFSIVLRMEKEIKYLVPTSLLTNNITTETFVTRERARELGIFCEKHELALEDFGFGIFAPMSTTALACRNCIDACTLTIDEPLLERFHQQLKRLMPAQVEGLDDGYLVKDSEVISLLYHQYLIILATLSVATHKTPSEVVEQLENEFPESSANLNNIKALIQ
jgi:hypothetical protein